MTSEREARMGLCALMPLGSPLVWRAVQEFGPVDVWEGFTRRPQDSSWGRRARGVDLEDIARATDACAARFVIPSDDEWPASLAALERVSLGGQTGPPLGLWVRGPRALREVEGAVAVVGSRACSGYGQEQAMGLSADLAASGRVVLSGLAHGIDAAAHRGALGARGVTAGVVACGVDSPYPAANAALTGAVAASGALISELPPGSRPSRHGFLARNRIIAALSAAVVIVEAALRSGAKNTTSWAAHLGRPVFALPGPVTSSLSATPHRLIRDGEAILITCADDVESVLSPLGTVPEPDTRGVDHSIDALPARLRQIREAIPPRGAMGVAELSRATGLSMMEVLAGAGELEATGWLERTAEGQFRLPGRR